MLDYSNKRKYQKQSNDTNDSDVHVQKYLTVPGIGNKHYRKHRKFGYLN